MTKKSLISVILIFALALLTASCGNTSASPTVWTKDILEAPEDFNFSMVWDVRGISSYDSKTGTLIKANDTGLTEDFTTVYHLSPEEKNEIYTMIHQIDLTRYPDNYDPTDGAECMPEEDFVLTVTIGDFEKTISSKAFDEYCVTPKGRCFLDFKDRVVEILSSTEEWKSLPDYKMLYE